MKGTNNEQRFTNRDVVLNTRLDAAGWGLFFVWIGIALVSGIGWGAGLLGVGIITLGGQAARKYFGLQAEAFWVLIGFLFFIGGIWDLAKIQFGLLPLLCIAMGVALLVSTFNRKTGDCALK
jgi:hypothetical protein